MWPANKAFSKCYGTNITGTLKELPSMFFFCHNSMLHAVDHNKVELSRDKIENGEQNHVGMHKINKINIKSCSYSEDGTEILFILKQLQ